MSKLQYNELSSDEQFKERISNFESSLEDIKKSVDTILSNDIYEDLTPEDKVRYDKTLDLFVSFTINSLYWLYLRTQGKDPSQTGLKDEINRVKEYMAKSKKLYERKHIMPRLDKGAADRFVKHGLWDPNQKAQPEEASTAPSQSLKRKREDEPEN